MLSGKISKRNLTGSARLLAAPSRYLICALLALFAASCSEIAKPDSEPFFAQPVAPKVQEFRWSNGKAPKSIDPALAAAPPETDIVRAIFEGLTELDPKTLTEVPASAEKWTSTPDLRTWTFYLRKDLKWSNGEPVTADDFVRSWTRLAGMGGKTAHRELLWNISGMLRYADQQEARNKKAQDLANVQNSNSSVSILPDREKVLPEIPGNKNRGEKDANTMAAPKETGREAEVDIGVKAISPNVLQVRLISPDKDLPKLLANPIFRPVYGDGKLLEGPAIDPNVVTNGAFRIVTVDGNGVTLQRADNYWNQNSVRIERVRFVPVENAESALDAYRAGALDAVTNAEFEPLALKLLAPFEDFQQTVHNAVNLYEFNLTQPPFTDKRVREALTISIERERLTEGEMKGSTEPANHLLPFESDRDMRIRQDVERAKGLLEEAGFADGEGFPAIRLVVNRNDTQQRIAQSVAKMWKQNLNLDTEVIVKESADLASVRRSGDFDLIRRGLVFPSMDTNASLAAIFSQDRDLYGAPEEKLSDEQPVGEDRQVPAAELRAEPATPGTVLPPTADRSVAQSTQIDAIYEFRVIPLYFPTSYSLVKPYVRGFTINGLDAPLLRDVSIDSNWQPKAVPGES
jgi:oligopeptide transport system substrate-binding protein